VRRIRGRPCPARTGQPGMAAGTCPRGHRRNGSSGWPTIRGRLWQAIGDREHRSWRRSGSTVCADRTRERRAVPDSARVHHFESRSSRCAFDRLRSGA
jgi:hypothetical protein